LIATSGETKRPASNVNAAGERLAGERISIFSARTRADLSLFVKEFSGRRRFYPTYAPTVFTPDSTGNREPARFCRTVREREPGHGPDPVHCRGNRAVDRENFSTRCDDMGSRSGLAGPRNS
jgi:hypothetical protein